MYTEAQNAPIYAERDAREAAIVNAYDATSPKGFLEMDKAERALSMKAEQAMKAAQSNVVALMLDEAKVGDGVTVSSYSDAHAYTIIKRTAKTIVLQEDDAELQNGGALKFHVGGFAAHCSNQRVQEYTYTPNTEAGTVKITRREFTDYDGNTRIEWRRVGTKRGQRGGTARCGRAKFYDYNF